VAISRSRILELAHFTRERAAHRHGSGTWARASQEWSSRSLGLARFRMVGAESRCQLVDCRGQLCLRFCGPSRRLQRAAVGARDVRSHGRSKLGRALAPYARWRCSSFSAPRQPEWWFNVPVTRCRKRMLPRINSNPRLSKGAASSGRPSNWRCIPNCCTAARPFPCRRARARSAGGTHRRTRPALRHDARRGRTPTPAPLRSGTPAPTT
jgi:hypothetical protein